MSVQAAAPGRELTVRGLLLGALITVVFTTSNTYLGLKIGLGFASSIPAAVISMALLRLLDGRGRDGNILENNLVQTQASAAGALPGVFLVAPALVIVGAWKDFPFWPLAIICAAGGMLGVLFTIPLRRALVTDSALPYPEGTAAAEVLRAGSAGSGADQSGLAALVIGGLVSAGFSLMSGGLRLFGDGIGLTLAVGNAVVRLQTGFSLALVGAGYLIGISGGLAILLGTAISWGVAVPVLTAMTPHPAGQPLAVFATGIWAQKVRLIGAGTIAVAAVWTLASLIRPVAAGLRAAFIGRRRATNAIDPRLDRDLSPRTIVTLGTILLAVLLATFLAFLWHGAPGSGAIGISIFAVLFCAIFGFVVAAACGYMAGIVGSSASPISGIAIVAVLLVSLIFLGLDGFDLLPAGFASNAHALTIGTVLFVTTAVIASASISNDNLQDLRTGQLLGATPWRQQVALLVGCAVSALVIPPVVNLLYHAYGFPGAMPRPGMDPARSLAAPQAVLLSTLARGIFLHRLDWTMILIGLALGAVLVTIDAGLRRYGRSLPVLAVGIGLYLPPTVGVTLAIGALLSWVAGRMIARRDAGDRSTEPARQLGIMLASGLIVGESLMGVALAAIIGGTGDEDALALVGPGFAGTAGWLGAIAFVLACTGLVGAVVRRSSLTVRKQGVR
jgi:putative OPT family oligopeptide transporter